MILHIKYMVSQRCKMLVGEVLKKMGLDDFAVELGKVELQEELTTEQRNYLKIALQKSGLELMDDRKDILTEKVKNVIIEMIHYADELPRVNYSAYISKKLGYDYTYLANTFSEMKGDTIQQYIINNKIEKVKELLLSGEQNLTEIAYMLNYSSVAHLSNQFKKITGLTPSIFRQEKENRKMELEKL